MRKFFLIIVLTTACSDQEKPLNTRPQIISVQAPSFVSSNDTVLISTYDKESDALSITSLVRTSDGQPVDNAFSQDFADDGTAGDRVGGDGVFTGVLNASALLAQATSEFIFDFTLSEGGKNASDPVSITILQNPTAGHPPVISGLTAADTVHTGQVTEFLLTVSVSDPEGLSDISSVTRVNVTLNGQPRALRDDGLNGDVTPSDGIFTERVSVNPAPAPGNYLFRVQAYDKLGLISNILEKTIVIAL